MYYLRSVQASPHRPIIFLMLVSLVNRLVYTEMPLLATGLDFQVNALTRGSLDQMLVSTPGQ